MNKLKNYVDDYFEQNLTRYTTNYTVSMRYLSKRNMVICRSNCRRLKLTLTAKINAFYSYSNSQIFTIKDGGDL